MSAAEVSAWVLIRRPIWDVYVYLENVDYLTRWMPFYSQVRVVDKDPQSNQAAVFDALTWMPLPYWVRVRVLDRVPGRTISYQCDFPPQTAHWKLEPSSQGTIVKASHHSRLWASNAGGANFLQPVQNEMMQLVLESLKTAVERSPEAVTRNVFFCYRRVGADYIGGRICDALQQEFGNGSVFRDIDSILGGQSARQQVELALQSCQVVVVLIVPGWEERFEKLKRKGRDDWVKLELQHAARFGKLIIPLFVGRDAQRDPIRFESVPRSCREALEKAQYYSVRADPDFASDMSKVIGSIWQRLQESGAKPSN